MGQPFMALDARVAKRRVKASYQSRLFGRRGHGRPGREVADGLASLPVGNGQLELRLEVQPELRVHAEPVAEAQGGVACNRALSCEDLANAVGGHVDLTREFGQGDADAVQLILEDFAGMHGALEHDGFSFHQW